MSFFYYTFGLCIPPQDSSYSNVRSLICVDVLQVLESLLDFDLKF
jgi:hypothetical protein